MATQAPDDAGRHKPTERQPAVWPWLLIPLIALALFFVLSKVREESATASASGTVPEVSPVR
jgi:hypothetical protein